MLNVEQQQFASRIVQLVNDRCETDLQRPPIVVEHYAEIAAALLSRETDGVRIFYGGPLDYRAYGKEKAWLVPAEVEEEGASVQFHLLYLNCTPEDARNVPVEFSYAKTELLKVGDHTDAEVRILEGSVMGEDKEPKIIIRPSFEGSLYYPKHATLLDEPSPEVVVESTKKLVRVLGLSFDADTLDTAKIRQMTSDFEVSIEYPQFFMGTPQYIESEAGPVYMYPIISPDDPWSEMQIFTAKPMEKIDKRAQIILRTDSGCDIGQLYHDRGCDCRPQLITALKLIQPEEGKPDGIVVHLPTQDGRGYGMNTKMETEGLKRGQRVIFNREDDEIKPLNTVEAAKKVFGEDYDVRTFDGVARLISEIGFRSVVIYTQYKGKEKALREYGLIVDQCDPKDESDIYNKDHIKAKHESDKYVHDKEPVIYTRHPQLSMMVNQIDERLRHESQST